MASRSRVIVNSAQICCYYFAEFMIVMYADPLVTTSNILAIGIVLGEKIERKDYVNQDGICIRFTDIH